VVGEKVAPDKGPALNGAELKFSTELLQLTNETFLPAGMTRQELVSRLQTQRAYQSSGQVVRGVDTRAPSEVVYVYVTLSRGTPLSVVDPYAWRVRDRDESWSIVAAWVEVSRLRALASVPGVTEVRTVQPPVARTGSVTAESDHLHLADQVRAQYGLTGAGIKIGVISDGVDHWNNAVGTGNLPGNLHVLRNTQNGDEGTAMLEIIHDIAPGAELYFHDWGENTIDFNGGIDALVNAGCTVIVDDVGWLHEPFFQDGIVASHVQSVASGGSVLYLSSAGNDAFSHYQGRYVEDVDYPGYHNKYLYVSIPPGGTLSTVLQWDDPWTGSSNDYDLYLFDTSDYNLLYSSEYTQDGDDAPMEYFPALYNPGSSTIICEIDVVNCNRAAAPRNLELFVNEGGGTRVYTDNIVAADSVYGHPAAVDAVAVGAIHAADPGTDTIAGFSSLGPVTIRYPSAVNRMKPDVTGIDGVRITGSGGFPSPFYGTSASAPGVAAVSALVWSGAPTKTATQVRQALLSSCTDLGPAGVDTTFGQGRANAVAFAQALGIGAAPTITSITPNTGASGATVAIADLAGTGFKSGATVKLQRPGSTDIAATGVSVLSASKITCQFALPSTAAAGAWNVVVTNPGSLSATLTGGFTITLPSLTVTSVVPNTGAQGSTLAITSLAGAGFQSGATVKLTRTGYSDIAATSVVVISPNTITCQVALPSTMATGAWNVVVTNPNGLSGTLPNGFTVSSFSGTTDLTYSGQKIVISQPGTYVLKNDITNSNQLICIEIQASNVVFDGGGHLIDGVDAESSTGIYVHGPSSAVSGVTIKNVRMQDWYYGIYLHEARSSRIEASTLANNAFTGAVVYKNAVGNTVTGCTITGNGYGLVFSDGAANGVVSNNEINQNERGLYVYLSDGIAVTGNRLANNINNGIQLHTSGGGSIYNNRLNNNLNVAFLGEPFKANAWSVTPGTAWNPANIVGGPKVGGNYWSRPDGTGFSQTNTDANGDGFVDIPYAIVAQNIDYYPLALSTPPGEIVAAFAADKATGPAPLAVQFTDTSAGSPTSWAWSFGDGYSSTLRSPSHTYATDGTYTVSLTVRNAAGQSDTETKTALITVSTPPTVTSIAPASGTQGSTLAITNLAGTRFQSGATVRFTRTGYSDIAATSVLVPASTKITCQLALPSTMATGAWNVVVTNPNGLSGTLPNGFTVASAAAFRFAPTSLRVPIGTNATTTLYLDSLAPGFSGLDATLSLSLPDPTVGEIVGVTLPGWSMTSNSTLPADTVSIRAVDLNNMVGPGGTALIGTVTIRGDRVGQTELRVTQAKVDDEGGNPVATRLAACAVGVVAPDIVTVPGGMAAPADLNADGKYDDVNGNGRNDFADIVLYFNQLSWIAVNEPLAAFDFNANGRIDFADVVWLFNNL
jgi:parallel beta-helix repeat protein